ISMFATAQKMFSSLDSFALLAVPFFVLSGVIMNSGGIAARLVLDGLKEVKLCVAYRMPDGREVTTTPLAADDWKGVEPIYETM
ncbi:adenylosuccinate synthetase, partial [Salmonella enterica subsp. enterica serovar Virginia]|nr:adenylosuccinate synthetase [Salmonella enterica subsp. enterica serovar Virginia]